MIKLGVILTAATVAILVAEWFRARKRPLPPHGWMSLLALLGAQFLMFRGVEPIATYFTPLAWTAYLLLADAAVFAVNAHSRLREEPRGFFKMALLSVPLWLIFEAYNLRLHNWTYTSLPDSLLARWFGYAWSFATITPAIFVTAELVESFGWFERAAQSPPLRLRLNRAAQNALIALGAVVLILPLALPQRIGARFFFLVWLGFIFLLDPVNQRLRLPSFLGDLERGRRGRLYSFLISGWICGWLWEFWNYWAAAKWIYVFPIFQRWKIFEMPAPGFLGFPPFALECFTMYVFAAWLTSRKVVAEKKYQTFREQSGE